MNVKLRVLVGLAIVALMVGACGTGGTATTGPTAGRTECGRVVRGRGPECRGTVGQPRHDTGDDQGLGLLRRQHADQAGPRRVQEGVPLDHRRLPGTRLGLDEREVQGRPRGGRGARPGDPRHDLDPDPGRERRARRPDLDLGWHAQRDADHRPVHPGRPGRDAFRERDGGDALRLRHVLAVLPEGPVRRQGHRGPDELGRAARRGQGARRSRPSRAASPTST